MRFCALSSCFPRRVLSRRQRGDWRALLRLAAKRCKLLLVKVACLLLVPDGVLGGVLLLHGVLPADADGGGLDYRDALLGSRTTVRCRRRPHSRRVLASPTRPVASWFVAVHVAVHELTSDADVDADAERDNADDTIHCDRRCRRRCFTVAWRAPWLDVDVVLAVAEVLRLVLPAAKTYRLRHVMIPAASEGLDSASTQRRLTYIVYSRCDQLHTA